MGWESCEILRWWGGGGCSECCIVAKEIKLIIFNKLSSQSLLLKSNDIGVVSLLLLPVTVVGNSHSWQEAVISGNE